ncbi:MAG: 4a-hydroxytetrahydrobiopterin dehydratase [Solirubrobacteraceae bacterium]
MAAGEQWKQDGDAIVRDLEFEDFKAAMAAVNRVADLAEEANHYPDILVHGYNRVRLKLTTHSEGRVTDADHEMAGRIDEIV